MDFPFPPFLVPFAPFVPTLAFCAVLCICKDDLSFAEAAILLGVWLALLAGSFFFPAWAATIFKIQGCLAMFLLAKSGWAGHRHKLR